MFAISPPNFFRSNKMFYKSNLNFFILNIILYLYSIINAFINLKKEIL